jgi:23S rRNA (pseudouridine1915-N3)-methyltransferase
LARELLILWAGRRRRQPWEELCADYRRRFEHELPVRDRRIKAGSGGDDPGRRRAEGEAMRAALPDPCWTIALDPRGRTADSEGFARELERLREEWPHPIAFLIGSDLGLDDDLVRSARRRLSLGPMVLGHELARLVLYEQIYRAFAIAKGIKYHRAPF